MLFWSKEKAADWWQQTKVAVGELLSIGQVWELSKLWYQDRMSEVFAGRSIADAHRIFETVGLNSSFWRFE